MTTKKCSECGRLLPITEFNLLRKSKDGHQDRCRDCFSKYNRERYAANSTSIKERVKKYRDENPYNELDTRMNACNKNPTQKNAYRAVEAAIRAGVLHKPDTCSMCGCNDSDRRIEAHHYDYAKPLDVIWLCSACHGLADRKKREHEGRPIMSSARPVLMIRDGEKLCKFPTIADAARAVGRSPSAISQCLAGISKTCGGFEWRYA